MSLDPRAKFSSNTQAFRQTRSTEDPLPARGPGSAHARSILDFNALRRNESAGIRGEFEAFSRTARHVSRIKLLISFLRRH